MPPSSKTSRRSGRTRPAASTDVLRPAGRAARRTSCTVRVVEAARHGRTPSSAAAAASSAARTWPSFGGAAAEQWSLSPWVKQSTAVDATRHRQRQRACRPEAEALVVRVCAHRQHRGGCRELVYLRTACGSVSLSHLGGGSGMTSSPQSLVEHVPPWVYSNAVRSGNGKMPAKASRPCSVSNVQARRTSSRSSTWTFGVVKFLAKIEVCDTLTDLRKKGPPPCHQAHAVASRRRGRLARDEFGVDHAARTVTCPAGHTARLSPTGSRSSPRTVGPARCDRAAPRPRPARSVSGPTMPSSSRPEPPGATRGSRRSTASTGRWQSARSPGSSPTTTGACAIEVSSATRPG